MMSTSPLFGWGCASDGQLGSPSTDIITPRPLGIPPSNGVIDFSPGLWSSLIITSEAVLTTTQTGIKCQGSFQTLFDRKHPTFVGTATGRDFVLLLSSTGGLYCFGSCAFGELGLGQRFSAASVPTRIETLSHVKIVDVAAAEFHWLALDASGTVFSCGNNATGQLGLSHSESVSVPCPITALWPHPIIAISTGDGHSAALSAGGNLFCFGSNKHGQLGNASFQIRVASLTPAPVSNIRPCPGNLTTPKVQLYENKPSEASHMDTRNCTTPSKVPKRNSSNFSSKTATDFPLNESHRFFVDVACGSAHTVALQSDGSLVCWGKGDNGQLGTRSTRTQYEPTLIDSSEYFVHVSAGQRHSAAVTVDGRAFMWGDGSFGQLGDGDVNDKYLPIELPSPQLPGKFQNLRFLRVKCGGFHTIGLVGDEHAAIFSSFHVYKNRISRCTVENMIQPKAGYSRFGSASLLLRTFVRPEKSHCSEFKVDYIGAETAHLKFIHMFGNEGKQILRKSAARIRREAQKAFGLISETTSPGCSNIQMDDVPNLSLVTPRGMFDKDERNFRPSVANSTECGYLFIIALMNPIYSDTECISELAELAAVLLRCEDAARYAFMVTLSFCEENVIVNRLLRPLHAVLTDELKGYRRITKNAIFATKMLALCYHGVMRMSGKSNTRTQHISPKQFCNETVSSMVNFSEDYERWALKREAIHANNDSSKSNAQSKSTGNYEYSTLELPPLPIAGVDDGPFSFCSYSFLLNEEAKFKILEIESKRIMSRESMRSLLSFGAAQIPSYRVPSQLRMPVDQLAQLQFLVLFVRRSNIVSDTYDQIAYLAQNQPRELRKPLKVIFDGEEGVDEGGVSKDFYQVLMERILSPDYGMFEFDEARRFHWFRKDFLETPDSWQLIGILFGLAAFNSILLDVQFPSVVYRKLTFAVRNSNVWKQSSEDHHHQPEPDALISYKPDLHDVHDLFPLIGKSLQILREYEGDDVEQAFGLTFEISYQNLFGKAVNVELIEHGAQVHVNNLNREKFIKLYTDFLINSSIDNAFKPFANGFVFMLDGPFVKKLSAADLETLIVGEKVLDFARLRQGSQYEGYSERSATITHLWQVLDEYDEDKKRLFLAFVTGTDRAPIGGLQKLKLTVQRAGPDSEQLPTSRTCFNILLLPEYGTRAKLRNRLTIAISNCTGFGLE